MKNEKPTKEQIEQLEKVLNIAQSANEVRAVDFMQRNEAQACLDTIEKALQGIRQYNEYLGRSEKGRYTAISITEIEKAVAMMRHYVLAD